MAIELSQSWANQFVALILDNEVTVGEFVITPPVPWSRLIQRNGIFQIGRMSNSFDNQASQVRDEKLGRGFVVGHHARAGRAGRHRGLRPLRKQRGPGAAACAELAAEL